MPAPRRSTRTASSTAARDSAQPYTTTRTNARRSPSARPSASVERSTTTGNKPGLRLTVKAPPSKLRQATSNGAPDILHGRSIPPNPYTGSGIESESDVTPAPPAGRMARSTRNPRAVVEPESEEDEEEEEEGDGEDEEIDGEAEVDQELLANDDGEDDEEDAEGEEEDMDDHPPPPIIKRQPVSKTGRAHVTVTAPPEGPLKSVETKQMEDDDDDDEELSELEEDDDENELDSTLANDPDDMSSDADAQGSRSATPDLSNSPPGSEASTSKKTSWGARSRTRV